MGDRGRPLVGRDVELATLAGVLTRAEAGDGAVCLLTGEPGIGKTSILETTAAEAARRGFAVAWGRAWEVGGAPAHWIWIEALRSLVAHVRGSEAERVGALILDGAEQATDSFQTCDAVARFLGRLAADRPVAIFFDDLHATDVASLQIALFVARQLAGLRLAMFGSFRDVEARMSPPVEDSLLRIARLGEVISVSRLDQEAVATLVRQEVGGEDAAVSKLVMEASEGNPLFVRELLRLIKAKADGAGVPSGVRSVIRERLALLSPASVALLQAAAVVGRECSVSLAADVAGVTASALEEAAAEATAAALVETGLPGRLRFSHALVAETLASDLAPQVRARVHRKAAEVLEARHGSDPAAPVAEIARHWLSAGAEVADRAATAARRAAEVAVSRLAFADAALLYQRALVALEVADAADTRGRVELMLAQCAALARSGDRGAAEAVCRAAAELARALDDGVLFARVALALGAELIVGKQDHTVKAFLEEAFAGLPAGDSAWRAKVMARLAGARQPERDPRGPIELARAAIAMARDLGDDEVLLFCLHAGMGALADYGDPAERLALNRETAALAAARGEAPYEIRARSRILFDCVDLLDGRAFDLELVELEALVARLGVPRYRWIPLAFAAMRADAQGRFADGDAAWRAAAELAGPEEGPFGMRMREHMRNHLTEAAADREREGAAVRTLAMPDFFMRYFQASVDARHGYVDDALAAARDLQASGQLDLCIGVLDVHGAHVLCDIAWFTRDKELAALGFERTEPMRGRSVAVTGMAFLLQTTVDHLLMRMAIVLERWDEMESLAASARAACERFGARPLLAHLLGDWAIGARARGDGARAAELAAEGEALAAVLGMGALAARCRALVSELGGARPATAAPETPVSLALEGEFWTVRGFGEVCRMRDSRGMNMLSMLIARPGTEIHVLELSGMPGAPQGDAGALLDDDARRAYHSRVLELRREVEDAEGCNDPGRLSRAQAELDALTAELSRAFGLGGRTRRAADSVERARSNVRRRIADAMDKIAAAAPAIGRHLAATVRTGIYCSYDLLT